MNKIKDKIKKWKNFNKLNKIYDNTIFIIEILLSIIMGYYILKLLCNYQETLQFSKIMITVSIIIVIPIILIILINLYKYRKCVQKLFLTVIIPIGILYAFIMLPDGVPDEKAHYYRAYELSQGKIIIPLGDDNKGTMYVPKDLIECNKEKVKTYSKVQDIVNKKTNYNEIGAIEEVTKTYSIIPYIPAAIVFAIGKVLNINIIILLYLIRIINLIIFAIIGYIILKNIPFGKIAFLVYMLTPIIIHQAASISFDSILNSIVLLFIAYNMHLAYRNTDLSVKDKLIYYILAISIAFCKYVYAPIILISLILLKNKSIQKKNSIKLIITSTILVIFCSINWFLFTSQYPDLRPVIIERKISAMEQLEFITNNPTNFLKIFGNTISLYKKMYLYTFVGKSLGWLDIKIPNIYIVSFIILLLISPFLEKHNEELNKKEKIFMLIIFTLIFILILVGLYLTWSRVQAKIIDGVQGRYFIPVAILLLLSMCFKNIKIKFYNITPIIITIITILNLGVLQTIIRFYLKI